MYILQVEDVSALKCCYVIARMCLLLFASSYVAWRYLFKASMSIGVRMLAVSI